MKNEIKFHNPDKFPSDLRQKGKYYAFVRMWLLFVVLMGLWIFIMCNMNGQIPLADFDSF